MFLILVTEPTTSQIGSQLSIQSAYEVPHSQMSWGVFSWPLHGFSSNRDQFKSYQWVK